MTPRLLAFRALPALLLLYCVASFVHFAHNAEFLTAYPNLHMPRSDSTACCTTAEPRLQRIRERCA
jgi:hypothetical protein